MLALPPAFRVALAEPQALVPQDPAVEILVQHPDVAGSIPVHADPGPGEKFGQDAFCPRHGGPPCGKNFKAGADIFLQYPFTHNPQIFSSAKMTRFSAGTPGTWTRQGRLP